MFRRERKLLCYLSAFSHAFSIVYLSSPLANRRKPTDHFSFSLNYFPIFVHFSRVSFQPSIRSLSEQSLCLFHHTKAKQVSSSLLAPRWNSREKCFSSCLLNQFRKAVEGTQKDQTARSLFETKIMRSECAYLSIKSCNILQHQQQHSLLSEALCSLTFRSLNIARALLCAIEFNFINPTHLLAHWRATLATSLRSEKGGLTVNFSFGEPSMLRIKLTNTLSLSFAGLEAQVQESSKDLYWF